MKVGDLVRWKEHGEVPGIILETKPLAGSNQTGTAVLAHLPSCPQPEWFHENELEIVNESR